jgi:O-antigen/teichoic acid export membrane protein
MPGDQPPPPSMPDSHSSPDRWRSLYNKTLAVITGRGAREGYLAMVDQGVISLSNFAATIILARNITPTQLGVYGVGFIALRLVRAVQEGLIIQPMNVYGAAMPEGEFKRYATSTSLYQILLAFLSALTVAILGWILTDLGNDTAGPVLFSLWFAFLWWQLQEYIRRMLYTRGSVRNAVFNTIIANAARLGIMIYWANQNELTGIGGLTAIAWGSLVALIPGLWSTRRYWGVNLAPLRETWEMNWNFGRWLLGSSIANWISVEFYPVLTAGLISFAAAGAYRALQNLVAPIHLILRATDTFLTPYAANIYEKSGQRALTRILRLIYIFTGIPILGILILSVLFSKQILFLIYGATYVAYSNGMILMAIFYALLYAYWPLQTIFKSARLTRPIFVANLLAIVAMFTIGIALILRWGVNGTIAGQALNALVINVVLWGVWLSIRRSANQ